MFEICGWIGGLLLICSFIPQIIKTYKCKKVDDISLSLYVMLLIGFVFQMIYSISIMSWPFIVNYLCNTIMVIVFLVLYFKYKGRK